MVFSAAGFPRVFPEKWLEQKSLKVQTKAEEEGTPLGENGGTEDARRGDGTSLKSTEQYFRVYSSTAVLEYSCIDL
jgi:hypothetical protein